MPLPIIDYFANGPQTINTNFKEDFSKGRLDWIPADPHTIKDYYELAELAISSKGSVGRFVREALNSSGLMQWLGAMPSQIPKALRAYQHKNKQIATVLIDNDINQIGTVLSPGQKLYRGGGITSGVQGNVLSTTFCPEVAINEAFYRGKAQKFGKIQIYVLEAVDPKTCVYVYKQTGTVLGHEREVLFASGAVVTINEVKKSGLHECGLPYEIISATISWS